MKTIMKTINSKTCANIMNLIQSILVIKNKREAKAIQKLIDKYGYAEIYVYCSKDRKGQLHYSKEYGAFYDIYKGPEHYSENGNLNGKVNFKFRCYKVEEIIFGTTLYNDLGFFTGDLYDFDLYKKSCLTKEEMRNYLKVKPSIVRGYAIHISELEIFDRPKELNEFHPYCKDEKCEYRNNHCSICHRTPLIKGPRNFCYVEVKDEKEN